MLIKNKSMQMDLSWFQSCLRIAPVIVIPLLFACADDAVRDGAPSTKSVDVDSIPDAVPRVEPKSKYGNPDSYEVFGKRYHVMNSSEGFVQRGIASWYGKKFHGRRTANGETYDMYAMTAAHKGLPIPGYVEVTNLKNNRRVVVRVNDRGPFHENRIIDLSYTAAHKLDIVKNGTGLVEIRAINPRRYAKKGQTVKHGAPLRTASTEKSAGGFYVQVGAFANADNARRLQTKLAGLGSDPVQVNEANVNGHTVYRVQIGPLHNVDVADRIVAQLGNYGVSEHSIVVN